MSTTTTIGYNKREAKSLNEVYLMDSKKLDWTAHNSCDHIPNAETIAAMNEGEEHLRLLKAGDARPRFNNLAEFFVSLLSESDEK